MRTTPMANEHEWRTKLEREGFTELYVQEDEAHVAYPQHDHELTVAHVVLEGEMTLVMNGKEHILTEGDRLDIPAGAIHSARMGPLGCRYLVGEK